MKIALVNNSTILPEGVVSNAQSPIGIIRHPIFEDYIGIYENVVVSYLSQENQEGGENSSPNMDAERTEDNLKRALKSGRIDFIDVMNVGLYSSFERSIVSIVTNHPSV